MKLLFIKPKHIGDSLLLTPTLAAVKHALPSAEISVLVRDGAQGILAGCPQIDRVFLTAAVDRHERVGRNLLHEILTIRDLRRTQFDYVFELGDNDRGRNFTFLSRAKHKYSVGPALPLKARYQRVFEGISTVDWRLRHRVEKDYLSVSEFLPLAAEIPSLVFERQFARDWAPAADFTDFAVLHVNTRQSWKRWASDNWLSVATHLLGRVSRLIISSGPATAEVTEAKALQKALGPMALCTYGNVTWAELAGLFYRARLAVSLDTASMHLAAACQCPTVALFGPTRELHWQPWKAPHLSVVPNYPIAYDDPREWVWKRTMDSLSVEAVTAACDSLMAEHAA